MVDRDGLYVAVTPSGVVSFCEPTIGRMVEERHRPRAVRHMALGLAQAENALIAAKKEIAFWKVALQRGKAAGSSKDERGQDSLANLRISGLTIIEWPESTKPCGRASLTAISRLFGRRLLEGNYFRDLRAHW